MSALLALLASAVWGTSDFAGGTLSRRIPSLAVVFLGTAIALTAVAIGLPWAHPPFGAYQAYGAGAGVAGAFALVAFYRAMAAGPMSLVAPLSATGTVIPVLWAFVRGESVGPVQGAGMLLAFAGVLLACGPEFGHTPNVARSTFLFTLIGACGFGLYFVLFALGSAHSVYGTLFAQRSAELITLASMLVRGTRAGSAALRGVSARGLGLAGIAMLTLSGLGDVTANGLYGLATRRTGAGLAVVTVLASLYPVATTLLARFVHGERLRAIQNVGVAAALGGILLINA